MDPVMPRLLVVHHTPSPTMHDLLASVLAGTDDDALADVEVTARPALSAGAADALAADGYLLGTPANIGTMSGALKHFFDQAYYPCLDVTGGRPVGLWVHGNDDTTGAVRDVTRITDALGWTPVSTPVELVGPPDRADHDRLRELGAVVAATLLA